MPTIVNVMKVLTAELRSRAGPRCERCHVARVVVVALREAALELSVGCHVEDEEAVRWLLLADVDRGDHPVAVPRAPLRQRVDQPLPRRWLPAIGDLLHGVGEEASREP